MKLKHIVNGAALCSLVVLSGCGSSGGATGNSGNTSQTSGGKVNISFWYGLGGSLSKDVQKMVKQFNTSHPNIHVTATYQGSYSGGGPEQQKLLAAIKAGDPPDLAQVEVHS